MQATTITPHKRTVEGDYAPDCGCGNPRCNRGWIWHMGSEYPCGWRRQRQERQEREAQEREIAHRDYGLL